VEERRASELSWLPRQKDKSSRTALETAPRVSALTEIRQSHGNSLLTIATPISILKDEPSKRCLYIASISLRRSIPLVISIRALRRSSSHPRGSTSRQTSRSICLLQLAAQLLNQALEIPQSLHDLRRRARCCCCCNTAGATL
jgi:hypothetical protein